jgi:hypothetical protein
MSRVCHDTEILISGNNFDLIDFGADYKAVRAAGRVPRSLGHCIGNLSQESRRSGKEITHTIGVIASVILKLSGCDRSFSHGLQDFLFASSFKIFGLSSRALKYYLVVLPNKVHVWPGISRKNSF